jgi:hypothetical protein
MQSVDNELTIIPTGEKGLWWHQQQEHGAEFSVAAASAASERQVLAIIPFQPQQSIVSLSIPQIMPRTPDEEDIYEWARQGDLKSLMQAVQVRGIKLFERSSNYFQSHALTFRLLETLRIHLIERGHRLCIGLPVQGT